jgi:pyruvate,orthophosphate dikinase
MSAMARERVPAIAPMIYSFGSGRTDGGHELRDLLGGKGANLAEMARLGLPVPPGFTITTRLCREYLGGGRQLPPALLTELPEALARLEAAAGATFGDPASPLLVSVRSGARVSMPGMMDTVLDLGLNDVTVEGLARLTGDRRFAFDSYRRFCAMYGNVVLGIEASSFERLFSLHRDSKRAKTDADLSAADFEQIVRAYRELIRQRTGAALPADPREQLARAIEAVFRSWENPRAIAYRQLNGIPSSWGTAVTVQAMVFGNLGSDSGTGVAFSRNPATGENALYGEFLPGAQGEDVVAGTRTPFHLDELARRLPSAHQALVAASGLLERHFRDLQDIEFTVQRGKLFVLQCRTGKRTGFASVRIAVDMADEGLLTREEAVARVEPSSLEQLLRPVFDDSASLGRHALARGLAAGPGAATGRIALAASEAEVEAARGQRVILVRTETSPEDIRGMAAAEGLLTAWGGMTSHAALVARQMGKVAVVGCEPLSVDEAAGTVQFATHRGVVRLRRGDWLSIDGLSGEVFAGEIPTRRAEVLDVLVARSKPVSESPITQRFCTLLRWADELRRLGVRANADQPDQAAMALALGAEGVGLCRTEHMFFGPGKIEPMRRLILARSAEERRAALAELLPLQRADFSGLFRTMCGRPVTIRLLDPPLHEFLPREEEAVAALAQSMQLSKEEIRRRAAELAETNPMLGLRGCRLGISQPDITEMQVRALFEAACDVKAEGVDVEAEVMVPLVSMRSELDHQARLVRSVAEAVGRERAQDVSYRIGTMIEIPRAALLARDIAAEAEFFSFGTNDLTQTASGFSRDDVGSILHEYLKRGILTADPFVTLDTQGVGELMQIATERGRSARPNLEIGICGEHGGDPASIEFCESIGLDYVSCAPARVPVARLAAAHAALRRRGSIVA